MMIVVIIANHDTFSCHKILFHVLRYEKRKGYKEMGIWVYRGPDLHFVFCDPGPHIMY